MSAYADTIANAVVTQLQSVSGAPPTVEYRMEDVVHPGDVVSAGIVIVTVADESEFEPADASGAGTDTDQGTIGKAYTIAISVYQPNTGDLTPTTRQAFVLACQQKLLKKTLAGASTVFGTKLVRRKAWENRMFGQAAEASYFAVVFYSAEPRLG